jgi:UDP-glucose 4-epimerase
MRVLVTGGAGFIGSHTCVELLNAGHMVMIFDDFSNSSENIVGQIEHITNKLIKVYVGDVTNRDELINALITFNPDAVIHLAGLKSVSESVLNPIDYYNVNVTGTMNLVSAMNTAQCTTLVFSSSATVYGTPKYLPIDEAHPTSPKSPYGRSKLMAEQIIEDWVKSANEVNAICLRYFNPIGAHYSGLIGEQPKGRPNNLMPLLCEVVSGKREELLVFGGDYRTQDGSAERDYVHVTDIAIGHLQALELKARLGEYCIINLGTGKSTTVIQLIRQYEQTNLTKIPFKIVERRLDDEAQVFASTKLAEQYLNFKCTKTLSEMCRDAHNHLITANKLQKYTFS